MAENPISRARAVALSVILLLCLAGSRNLLPVTEAIWVQVPSTGTKCLSEEIQSNVVVLADYYAFDEAQPERFFESQPGYLRVTSPFGNNLHHNENVTHGQFAFTTTEAGNYLACFWLSDNQQEGASTTLGLDWRIGIAAKDWDSVAKKEKLEGIEFEIRKLEAVVQSIHTNLIYLKNREAEMREVSETTNGRVAWFSIMSLGVCIIVSVLQLSHLKRYFRKRNLSRSCIQVLSLTSLIEELA